MEPEGKKKPVWTIILSPLGVILLTIFLLIGGLGVLAFGNTQWNKWIYVFQGYFQLSERDQIHIGSVAAAYLKPSVNFTGLYRAWHRDGSKFLDIEYLNGKHHGKAIFWHSDSNKWLESNFINGEKHGKCIEWNAKRQIIKLDIYVKGYLIKSNSLDPKTGKMVVTFEKKIE